MLIRLIKFFGQYIYILCLNFRKPIKVVNLCNENISSVPLRQVNQMRHKVLYNIKRGLITS